MAKGKVAGKPLKKGTYKGKIVREKTLTPSERKRLTTIKTRLKNI